MKLAMIVAAAQNWVIGRNDQLPWYLPEDLKYFKQVTMAKPIIMGRKTYESIGRPLPGRTNIVITRDASWSAEGVKVCHSLDAAIGIAEAQASLDGADEVMVIGGAEIYRLCLPQADRLYFTEVHAEVDGDAFFPEFDRADYIQVGRQDYFADGPNPYDYSFVVYDRK